MFPALKAEWGLSDKELGALTAAVFDYRRSVRLSHRLAGRSLEPREEHRRHGRGVEHRDHRLRLLAQLRPASGGAGRSLGSAKQAMARRVARCSPACFRRRDGATMVGGFLAAAVVGSVLGVALGGFLTARWGWQAAFGVVGLPGLVLALLFLLVRDYRTVPLTDPEARRLGGAACCAACWGRARRCSATPGGALQLLTVSTVYVWLPSYLNRFHGLATDKAGLMTALVLVLGSVGIVLWGYVADRVGDSSPQRKLMVPAACLVVAAVLLSVAFGAMQPGSLQFVAIAAGGFMMTAASGTVSRRRHRRHPSRPARHRRRHGRRGAEPVRPRRRATDHRRAVRRLRPGDGLVDHAAVLHRLGGRADDGHARLSAELNAARTLAAMTVQSD
jgi:hypothetical protein